jgi:[ribosomal protein S5]-alanine N-acetyltransferase
MHTLETERLVLVPVSLDLVEAVLADQWERVEHILSAKLPRPWPGRALIEQAFSATLDAIRARPRERLWGDRIILERKREPNVVGSVVFHGEPSAEGTLEIGYGVFSHMQGNGYAPEAVRAQAEWAFRFPEVARIHATTPPWHAASIRVLEKCGFTRKGNLEHEHLGEIAWFELARP